MKLAILSDTHGHHENIQVPDADVLICCGDITEDTQRAAYDFDAWLGTLPHKHKLVIAGNHDQIFVSNRAFLRNATYLEDSGVTIDGVNFWGSPWTRRYGSWPFQRSARGLAEYWARIPEDTHVLITHGPPYGILDRPAYDDHAGCLALRKRIADLPKLWVHCFGHIHDAYGTTVTDGVCFVNAAVTDARPPIRVSIPESACE